MFFLKALPKVCFRACLLCPVENWPIVSVSEVTGLYISSFCLNSAKQLTVVVVIGGVKKIVYASDKQTLNLVN